MKFIVVLLLLTVIHQIYAETVQQELVRLTNEYRAQNGLSAIPMSYQLTKVAVIHTLDMAANGAIGGECNLHSWSNKGYGLWNGCCYTSNHTFASCMWKKPKEISGSVYNGNGYENAAYGGNTASGSLQLWKNSAGHNDVILNKNSWASLTWRSIGASLCNNYAVLWFSDTADPSTADAGELTCASVTLPNPPVAPVSAPVAAPLAAPIGTPIAPNTPSAPVSENSPTDQTSPVADGTPLDQTSPQGNTPSTGTGPSSANTPSSGPSIANSPSDSINKPSSGHANSVALVGSALGLVALF